MQYIEFVPDEPGKPLVLRDDQQFHDHRGREQEERRKEPERKRAGLGVGTSEPKRQQQRRQGERKGVDELEIETHRPPASAMSGLGPRNSA